MEARFIIVAKDHTVLDGAVGIGERNDIGLIQAKVCDDRLLLRGILCGCEIHQNRIGILIIIGRELSHSIRIQSLKIQSKLVGTKNTFQKLKKRKQGTDSSF